MRTKTLLLTAALGAAGLASASAQVFSVNAVGFINLSIPKGFSMIANQLLSGNDTVGGLLATAPDGTVVYKFNAATGYSVNINDGGFARPTETLNPGEGAFLFAPSAFTVTFVGEVPQGARTTSLPKGFSIAASQVPQSAKLSLDAGDPATTPNLGFPIADGDVVYRFDNASGAYVTKISDAGWQGGAPVPNVGESFFVNKFAAVDWVRTFSVNTP